LWQVTARQDPSFQRNMALDVEYIENWDFWMDLQILCRTVPAVLSGAAHRIPTTDAQSATQAVQWAFCHCPQAFAGADRSAFIYLLSGIDRDAVSAARFCSSIISIGLPFWRSS